MVLASRSRRSVFWLTERGQVRRLPEDSHFRAHSRTTTSSFFHPLRHRRQLRHKCKTSRALVSRLSPDLHCTKSPPLKVSYCSVRSHFMLIMIHIKWAFESDDLLHYRVARTSCTIHPSCEVVPSRDSYCTIYETLQVDFVLSPDNQVPAQWISARSAAGGRLPKRMGPPAWSTRRHASRPFWLYMRAS
ncbi:hypothetical protein FA95DRAFT_916047 [Auriscalpium vulgare]|uniref:Uncharacterized protein n=1 Tax=Auriscalpium vulgare TaxID=40419 RepID=A0ACB8R7Q5_9AGAM|nr:hypothetical protein FA95DRAFT_916047 [Auriscalpium vulgare]